MFRPILRSFSGLDHTKITCAEPRKQQSLCNRHPNWDDFRRLINKRLALNVSLKPKKLLKQQSSSSTIQYSGRLERNTRTIPTERPPLVGEVSANFCGYMVPRGQRDVSLLPYSQLSRPEPLLFLSSSSSVVLTRLSGSRSRRSVLRKSGRAKNRTRASGSVARNSDR
jgi:hypothetical protein